MLIYMTYKWTIPQRIQCNIGRLQNNLVSWILNVYHEPKMARQWIRKMEVRPYLWSYDPMVRLNFTHSASWGNLG